ncbi:hypothetical protein CBS101457_006704 [Exobasidium rhododendri]|nr:hypothetical protein CBS101457_006704 [Exobasidium rhododendri]
MSVATAKSNFFNAQRYAVVGASKDRTKFGNKVLRWYKDHGLNVTPINPKESSVEELPTLASILEIKDPKTTCLSVITPPKVTLSILKTALLELQVAGIWLQPGAEDSQVKEFVDSCTDEMKDKVILGGPCILVEGASLAKDKGKL